LDKPHVVFDLEGSFYAIDNTCTHRGGPLCEGEVAGEEVTCPVAWGRLHQDRYRAEAPRVTRRREPPCPSAGGGRGGRGV